MLNSPGKKGIINKKGKGFGMRKNKRLAIEWILVAMILFVGIFIGAYHFGMIPVGLHQDEVMEAVDAKVQADYGTDRFGMRYPVHFMAWKSGQMSVLLSYLMVPFIKVFGFSVTFIRLPMLVVSCIGLLSMYLVGRDKFFLFFQEEYGHASFYDFYFVVRWKGE